MGVGVGGQTHGMACATVTSFGRRSAGGGEAVPVGAASPGQPHTTVNKDYDHIMQMAAPSVHSSLVLGPHSLFVF